MIDFVREARLAPDPATARQRARLAGLVAWRDGKEAGDCPFAEPELREAWLEGLAGRPNVALAAPGRRPAPAPKGAAKGPARPATRRDHEQGRRQWWQDL